MARRRRPAGERGTTSARSARDDTRRTAATPSTTKTATRQLTLPLPPDQQPRTAHEPVDAPSPSLVRAVSTLSVSRDTSHTDETNHGATSPQARSPSPSGPRGAHLSVHARLADLRSALADGWEIVQPIFARPLWSVSDNSATAFNFVLRRERATRLVTVPESRGVQRFIRDHHLTVDYRS